MEMTYNTFCETSTSVKTESEHLNYRARTSAKQANTKSYIPVKALHMNLSCLLRPGTKILYPYFLGF